jgi:tRNA A-37 threonylcarbamoyl transferase component Bud32
MSSAPPQSAAADSSPSPALIAGRFAIESTLGRGGMGTVFKVRDRFNDRLLALKRVPLANERARSLLEREYTTLARLAHPSIIEVYDYALDSDGAYYTMEPLDGQDLANLAPLPFDKVCRYLRQVATSLTLLHARGLVHRDVSPRNVRVTADDRCKLIDFGGLGAVGESAAVVGTPPCVPPEALEGEALDERVDLYALGCLAYFTLTGRHAYPAGHIEQLPSYWAQPIEPPSRWVARQNEQGARLPAVPEALDQLVLGLLQLNRSARPKSAGAVIDSLNAIAPDPAPEHGDLARSYLASAPTVGRAQQLEMVGYWLQRVQQQHGQVVLLEGAAGSGKTRALEEIALAVRVRGVAVVVCDGQASERPYSTVSALCKALFEVAPNAWLAAAEPHAALIAQLVPELAAPLGVSEIPAQEDDTRWHNRAQEALRNVLLTLSGRVPLALCIDDLHACDYASAAVIAALACSARTSRLLLIATCRSELARDSAACRTLRALGAVHRVANLTSDDVAAWCAALFGADAPNLSRMCEFVQTYAAGNPRDTDELLHALLQTEQVRYRDGMWVLPLAPAEHALPATAGDAMRARVAGLSDNARGVARALCLYRGTLSRSLCEALCDLEQRALDVGLGELLAERILLRRSEAYVFANEAVRDLLAREIDPRERAALQMRIGRMMLARNSPHLSEQLGAGLHLLEAGDEQGLALLCRGGAHLCSRPEAIVGCVPILERALELARALGKQPHELAMLLAPLAVGAYVVDRRLERYAPELLACFATLSGLHSARRLERYLGRRLSVLLCLGWAALRHRLRPRRERHVTFATLLQLFVGAIVTLSGKAAICLDGKGLRALRQEIEPLRVLGADHAVSFAHDYCELLELVTSDRHARTYAHGQQLERRLHSRPMQRQISAELRRMWQGGLHYVLGVLESFAGDPKVLARVQELEQSDFSVDKLIACQLLRVYHTFRGDAEAVREANARVDGYALQTGTTWQVEMWSAIFTNYAAAMWGDPVDAKQALDETERLAAEVPSLQRYALSSRGLYHRLRGQTREASAALEQVMAQERPFERIGWSPVAGVLADAYNAAGEYARAKELCERVQREAEPGDAIYIALGLPLASAMLGALVGLGEHARAQRYAEELLSLHAANPSPLVQGALHEAAARAAFGRGDRKAFTHHLKQVETYFCPLGQPALIGRFLQLTALGGTEGSMSAKIALMREVQAFDGALTQLNDRRLLARHILSWLMQRCEGFEGYLFAQQQPGAPLLLAATSERDAPASVLELAQRSMRVRQADDVTTHCGPADANTHAERPGAKHGREAPLELLHVHLLSYVDREQFFGEGALVLRGEHGKPSRLRYDLLHVAARHLNRLRPPPQHSLTASADVTTHDHSRTA